MTDRKGDMVAMGAISAMPFSQSAVLPFFFLRFPSFSPSCCLLLACCLLSFFSRAQQPTAASSTSQRMAAGDSTALLFTFVLTPERSQPVADTLPDLDFRMYDPTRRQTIDWGNLGNLGSSARPLFFETPAQRGFDLGLHSFDLYKLQPEALRFYRNRRSYSEVFFSQGRNQFEGMLSARLARTFAGGASVSLDYRTINNLGQYRYQRDKHNTLAVGLWLPVGKRYDGFLIFSNNINRQQENGGIVTDTAFGSAEFSGPIAAEVRLPDQKALTRQSDQTLQLTQHLKFTGANSNRRVLRATHTFAWLRQDFKFADAGLQKDSFFFANFLVDRRGIRHFIGLNRLDNQLTISTFKANSRGRPSDMLAVGLAHAYFRLKQEPRDSAFSNLFLTGNLALTPSEKFGFVARGSLGLLKNIGEYQLSGVLTLGLGRAGQLRASLLSQRRPPSLLQNQLFVSKRAVWKNDFLKPVENTLSITYALPKLGLELTGLTHLVSNYLYYDPQGLPVQTTVPVQVAQLLATENLHFGGFHFDNTFALQQSNRLDEVLRLPRWFSKNSLYFAGKIFKKRLLLTAGADFRLNSEFRPDGYQPLTGQFHLQDTLRQKPYPWLDVFVAFKVQTFRFFIRYENALTIWDPETVFYQTARYPQPFKAIRLGIAWRFMDSNLPEPSSNNTPPPGVGGGGSGIGRRGF